MDATDDNQEEEEREENMDVPVTPPGLEAIYLTCRKLYPDQPNPLQVTAVVKYWLGGPDPLDYISMYSNAGDPEHDIPPHWHYVSLGLSDLHGDGRVYEINKIERLSGFGFELTFRLKREPGEMNPPTWPAALMQALARYVFQSANILCSGDHVSWHAPLDNSESRVQHMLMTEDVQLQPVNTPFGFVTFIQIIGVCTEELKASQHWNGSGVIDLLRTKALAGGPWLITDMRRGESIFEIDPALKESVDNGIDTEGSNLSGVSGQCSWEAIGGQNCVYEDNKENSYSDSNDDDTENKPHISPRETEQIRRALAKGLNNTKALPQIKTISNRESFASMNPNRADLCKESVDDLSEDCSVDLCPTRILDSVHLKFNMEAGSLISLALKGRLRHGRHFTFTSVLNDIAITFVASSVIGSIADEEHPYAAHGPWLQVLLTEDFIEQILHDTEDLKCEDEISSPRTFNWPEKHLRITILPDQMSPSFLSA